jgi:hypothetical protein
MPFGLVFDGVLAMLLAVTIGYCALLYRRLGALRAAREEMQALAQQLGEVTARAEAGLDLLREAAEDASSKLAPRIERAKTLASDLDMLCHRAGKLADRLEPIKPAAKPAAKAAPRSHSEHALIEALRASR